MVADPARPAGFQRSGAADGGGLERQRASAPARRMCVVRDPLVAEPLLPRFLAPGDQARLTVLLQNLDLPAGEAVATVSVEGPLALAGAGPAGGHAGARRAGAPFTTADARPAPGAAWSGWMSPVPAASTCSARRRSPCVRRAASPPRSPAASWRPARRRRCCRRSDAYLPGTWRASASFGGAVRYDVAGLVQALDHYPLNCLEQATSRGLPLALLPDGPLAGAGPRRPAAARRRLRAGSPALRRRLRPVVGRGRRRALAVVLRHRVPAARPRCRRGGPRRRR